MGSRIALVAAVLCLFRLCLAAPATELKTRACIPPPVNDATIDLVTDFEGFEEYPDVDGAGNGYAIGHGHLCGDAPSDCYNLGYSIPISRKDAEELMHKDLGEATTAITMGTASSVVLNANQYGALVSWAYNVGNGNVETSTLMSRLNAGEDPNAVIADELPLWNKDNGVVIDGLVRRRDAEVALGTFPTNLPALPVPC